MRQRVHVLRDDVRQRDIAQRDRRRDGESAGLDAVRHHAIADALQSRYPVDLDDGGAGAPDLGAHLAQELGQVDDLRFRRGVLDDGSAVRESGGHQDVLGAGVAGIVEVEALAIQLLRLHDVFAVLSADCRRPCWPGR